MLHNPGAGFCLAHTARLPPDMADAIGLVLGQGFSYDEAAALCACAPGTLKSRVSRARALLVERGWPQGRAGGA